MVLMSSMIACEARLSRLVVRQKGKATVDWPRSWRENAGMIHEILNMGFYYLDAAGNRHASPHPVLLDLSGQLLPAGAEPTYLAYIDGGCLPAKTAAGETFSPGIENVLPAYRG